MAAGNKPKNRIWLQTNKEKGAESGWPYFGRYLKEAPNPVPQGVELDIYQKNGKNLCFQKFDFVSGYLVSVFTEEKEILKKKVKELSVVLGDETSDTKYEISLGSVRSSYSRSFLQRMCSPELDPNQPIELRLRQFDKSDGTKGTTLSVRQNGETITIKDDQKNVLPYLKDMPAGVPTVVNDEKITDYSAQMAWLFKTVMERLPAGVFGKNDNQHAAAPANNNTQANPAPSSAPVDQSRPAEPPKQEVPVDSPVEQDLQDDNSLPF